ncbi:uncharacterized protein LOC121619800 isoform X2 [Chelmon rostratus]|uniref:uncharacterized protein LOC121619800 isoform X2 n=1 Tax=Chelmon rostratus TaxID=109905 RepID=UPI001BEBF45D|nr:uncharacterized protein LOC121619800 isoform X2 [Chelmon rostratus]
MEYNYCECQVCLYRSNGIADFKRHVRSTVHRKKMEEVFQKKKFSFRGFFPPIIVMDPKTKQYLKRPIIGLNLLTLCFSTETKIFFYLCHVCEERCPPDRLLCHLFSSDHCSNYFSYTDPNVLSFSWLPNMNMRVLLRAELTRELNEGERQQLQMLDLPETLLKKLERSTYSEVMRTLSENDKLLKLLEAGKPKRTMIQTYQRDSNRKHPLLGMQHLIECICVGPTERRHYLCTLCNLTLATHMIIKHVLSFDHIFHYFRSWHPSTLMSKECYRDYTNSFASMMLDFAKQAVEIHGTADADMKQVSLEPAKFTSVNFTCYAEALKELESIPKEDMESSLITSIKAGNKLERHTVSAGPAELVYKLHCQDCNEIFNTESEYSKHVSELRHKEMLRKFFGKAERADGYDREGRKVSLGLYRYHKESLKQNQPAIGVSLVVACVSSQAEVEPIYVCFACQDCFPEVRLTQHFDSRKHLIRTLLYLNPWRLPFAWDNHLDMKVLQSMAWEEEKERGPKQMKLKVLDIPYCMFWKLIPSYPKVMETLKLHHILLKREVPRCETNSKLQQNERFPLLGQQFMVMHDVCSKWHPFTTVAFLCLLCKRSLSDKECYAHVFSREHVSAFLNHVHPGSLNSSTDAQTLLDLAKQAARIHSVLHVQDIKLDKPIWEPYSYQTAISILSSAKKRAGKGKLQPVIMPKMKLVPREFLKDVDEGHVRDNSEGSSQVMEGSEKQSGQQSTDNSETTLRMISAEITNQRCESKDDAEKMASKETPMPSENKSEKRGGSSSEEIKNAGSETSQVKMEKMKEPAVRSTSGEPPESYQKGETAEERSKTSRDALTQEQRQVTAADDGESGVPNHETAKDKDSSGVKQQQAVQLWQYVKRKSREPVIGLGALLECNCDEHDPIYLCECCSMKIPEMQIISHVTGVYHQKLFLGRSQKLTLPPKEHLRKNIRHLATLFEQENGYGEAQVVDLDEEIYNNILKQNFKSAIETVKALQAEDRCRELPLSSAPSAVQPVETPVVLHAQLEDSSLTDDHQVVNMEVDDDSEDSEPEPSSVTAAVSVMTESNSKTTDVPQESNEDVKLTQIKVSESADNANAHLTVSRSSEDASSLHVSTSRTNTTCLHPDSTGKDSKAEIIPNTTVAPLQIASHSIIVGTSQHAAASDPAVTTPTVSTTAISKCPAKSSDSSSDASKSPAPISNRATTSSCTTSTPTTSRLRENTCKNVVATSSATAATTKQTAASADSSTTSKTEHASKNTKTVPQTTRASKAMVTAVQCENTKASAKTVHRKKSVQPSADVAANDEKSSAPAASHLTALKPENKNPSPESSHTSTSKTKPSESPPKVGLNQLIVVFCGTRKQVYCQLCSVRLKRSDHLFSFSHKYNYVKKVNSDEYKKLAALPDNKALERLKAMMKEEDSQVSSSTSDTAVSRLQAAFASPCEASSPDDGVFTPQSDHTLAEREKEHELQTLLAQIPETESISKEEGNPAANQLDRSQSSKSSEPGTHGLDPLSSASEYAGRYAQIPDKCQETAEARQQQERSDPELQDAQKVLEGTRLISPVKFFNPDPLPSAASLKTEQRNQSRHVPKRSGCSAGPGDHSALSRILVGERTHGRSHLYSYLTVTGLGNEPVIGLGSVWECRAPKQMTFFLCESCRETLHLNDICQHMYSIAHQLTYVRIQRPEWYKSFWLVDDLLPNMKLELLKDVARMLSEQERYEKIDAQIIHLREDLHKCIQTAPFSEALRIVQNIKKEPKLSCLPISAQPKEQQPEDRQSREESLPTDEQSTRAPETDQRGDNEVRQETEKRHLEETAMVGDLLGVKQRRVSSPLDVYGVSSKADCVVFPFPAAGTCHNPQETYRSLSMHPELRPPVTQRPDLELQVKQNEVHSESTSSSVVSPKKCLPTRKRPAVTSFEVVRPATSNCQLEDPLPAKRTCGSLQPISQHSTEPASESTPVNHAAASYLLPPQDRDAGPGSVRQSEFIVDHARIEDLISLVEEKRAEGKTPAYKSAPDNADTTRADDSSEYSVEGRCYPVFAETGSKMATKQTRQDSKKTFSAAAPVVSGYENQLAAANASSASHSSLEAYLVRGNLLLTATEAKAVGTVLPSASTADPSDPQQQRSINAQNMSGTVSQFEPSPFQCAAINYNPGQMPQPRARTKADSTGRFHFPISTIVTARPASANQQCLGGYNRQGHTEMKRGNQVAHSFSTVATVSPSDTLAASGGGSQCSQMAYASNLQVSDYGPAKAVAGCTTSDSPLVFTESLHQHDMYTRLFYPSQIYPAQEAMHFEHSLATPTPPAWASLEMQLQLMQQQQHSICSSAALAAGGGNRTSAYVGPFTTSANRSQMFIDLNDYSAKTIAQTQNRNGRNTQNNPGVYLSPAVVHCPPAANSEMTSQTPVNSFAVAPSMVSATLPVSHNAT